MLGYSSLNREDRCPWKTAFTVREIVPVPSAIVRAEVPELRYRVR